MSVASEIERIENGKEAINDHLETLGVNRGGTINDIAQNITVLQKPTGNKGQLVGFVDDNAIGAVDPSSGGGSSIERVFVRQNTSPMSAVWLSLSDGGDALIPSESATYIIKNSEDYYNRAVVWNGSEYEFAFTKRNAYLKDEYITQEIPMTTVPTSETATLCDFMPNEDAVSISISITGYSYAAGSSPFLRIYSGGELVESIKLWSGDFLVERTFDDQSYLKKQFAVTIYTTSAMGYKVENATGTVVQHTKVKTISENYIGASDSDDGKTGLVPSASAGQQNHVLCGDGKWHLSLTDQQVQRVLSLFDLEEEEF